MERSVKLALVLIVISMLVSDSPTEAWYKQVAGPNYYSVGRASGLLSGIRRLPYTRRAEPASPESEESAVNDVVAELNRKNAIVKSMAVCVKDVTPKLKSCELQDDTGLFKCAAEVIVSLDSSDCEEE